VLDNNLPLEEAIACEVCVCDHDEEIHQATVRIHEWLRYELTKFWDDEIPVDEDPVEFFLMENSAA